MGMKTSSVSNSALCGFQSFPGKSCRNIGIALVAMAAFGTVALLAASALFTIDGERIVLRDPSERLGNIQNLADLLLIIAGIR